MNRFKARSTRRLAHTRSWLAASALVALLAAFSAATARAQAQTPPQGAPGGMRPHGQMGMHPQTPQTAPVVPTSTRVETAKITEKGEQFFIIASIDQTKAEILLKRPDEVTELLNTTPKTQYLDQNGKPLKLADLRAGDTVWVASSGGANPTATRVRKGQMTVADLHRYYLDYPEIK